MRLMEVTENGTTMHFEQLRTLFSAFRDRNDDAFHRAAEALIANELAANHHSQARELLKALTRNGAPQSRARTTNGLSSLPKDRRHGQALLAMTETRVEDERLVLPADTKSQLERVVSEHTNRVKLAKYGLRPKTKLLFWGPPGCGKTLCAHWLASQLNLPLGTVRLSTLITSFLGETASHIQRVFETAQATPMVLLIDEADAIAKDRDDRNDVGELKRVVNSLLQAMDAFQSTESILIAASNHQYLFDNALWRRFDDVMFFPIPTSDQTGPYLRYLLNGVKVVGSLDGVAKAAASLSYAQIEKGVAEVLKTMILSERAELKAAEITGQFKQYRGQIRRARSRPSGKITADE